MEALVEFGKIILPAGAVLYAMYLTIRLFLKREFDKKLIDLKTTNKEIILPVRLQAYERICLFLERILPKNLVVRLNSSDYTAAEFQQILVQEIRNEFAHNLSQQVYMSEEAWEIVKNAVEEVVMMVNESAGDLAEEARSIDLAKRIFDKSVGKERLVAESALSFVKQEIQQSF